MCDEWFNYHMLKIIIIQRIIIFRCGKASHSKHQELPTIFSQLQYHDLRNKKLTRRSNLFAFFTRQIYNE